MKIDAALIGGHEERPEVFAVAYQAVLDRHDELVAHGVAAQAGGDVGEAIHLQALVDVVVAGQDDIGAPFSVGPAHGDVGAMPR